MSDKNTTFRMTVAPPGWIYFFLFTTLGGIGLVSPLVDLPRALSFLAMFVVLMTAHFLAERWAPTLIVGRDGLLVRRRFGANEFFSHAEILAVDRYSTSDPRSKEGLQFAGITLHLQSKKFVQLPIGSPRAGDTIDHVTAPFECIRDALATWRARAPNSDAHLLERNGRVLEGWLEELRDLGRAEDSTYRVAATSLDRETLFTIAEDPANKASLRGAAAVALGVKLDDEARTRLRVASEAIADPKLRTAFAHVVEEKSEEDIERALQDLDPVQQV